MLQEGKHLGCRKTGASTATISRVSRSLNYGSDGYDMVFERLLGEKKVRKMHRKRCGKDKQVIQGTCRYVYAGPF